MLFEYWEKLPVMIEEIKTRRLERMVGSKSLSQKLVQAEEYDNSTSEGYIYYTELYFNTNDSK
jgi:hypothetical protein